MRTLAVIVLGVAALFLGLIVGTLYPEAKNPVIFIAIGLVIGVPLGWLIKPDRKANPTSEVPISPYPRP